MAKHVKYKGRKFKSAHEFYKWIAPKGEYKVVHSTTYITGPKPQDQRDNIRNRANQMAMAIVREMYRDDYDALRKVLLEELRKEHDEGRY